jgi:hypothetical protein
MAIALAVVLLSGGLFSSEKTEANAGATPDMSFGVADGSDCSPSAKPTKCNVSTNTVFHLTVNVNTFPPDPDGTGPLLAGYSAMAADVDWTGTALNYTKRANATEVPWPQRGNSVVANSMVTATNYQYGDLSTGSGSIPSTFKGVVINLEFACKGSASTNVITLKPYDAGTNPGGSSLADTAAATNIFPTSDSITINCVLQPTFTPTNTRTNTPTATNTPTQVPIPRMMKCELVTKLTTGTCKTLVNLFLTRQGAKIPPFTCEQATNVASLVEQIHIPISGPDPKDPSQPRKIGGFSFQVKFDHQKVCVSLAPGPAWSANPQQICTVDGSTQGVARINCVTLGKATVIDTNNAIARVLAIISIRAQPEAYSQIRANQDNGQAVQINDELCKLTDLQGHAIPTFSCEDADITIRFLEGDVEPDCQVNTLDTQSIAFRWGAQKGSLVYNSRFNLEPSGTQADQDIDVNDLQFVYGENPWNQVNWR